MHIRAAFRTLLICLLLVLGAPVATTSALEPTPTPGPYQSLAAAGSDLLCGIRADGTGVIPTS